MVLFAAVVSPQLGSGSPEVVDRLLASQWARTGRLLARVALLCWALALR